MSGRLFLPLCALLLLTAGCPETPPPDAGTEDAGAETPDAGGDDSTEDAGPGDGGFGEADGGLGDDAGAPECGARPVCRRNIDCGGGSVCSKEEPEDEYGCCVTVFCTTDADCLEGEECNVRTGICMASLACDSSSPTSGCADGEVCLTSGDGAECVPVAELPAPASCAFSPRERLVLAAGAHHSLLVTAFDEGGAPTRATPAFSSDVGTIEQEQLFRPACAGPSSCTGTVTASFDGAALCSLPVTVLPALASGDVRVTAISRETGAPLAGARLSLGVEGEESLRTGTADADGSWILTDIPASTILLLASAFPDEHEWVTVLLPGSRDILLVASESRPQGQVAGVKGSFDYNALSTIGDIKVGVAGVSSSRSVLDRTDESLFGALEEHTLILEGVTDADGESVLLPRGLELILGVDPVKEGFVALGDPGERLVWSIARKVRLAEIGPLISTLTAGDEVPQAAVAVAFATFGQVAEHGVLPVDLSSVAAPTSAPTIPFESWALPERTLTPDVVSSAYRTVEIPTLPCRPGGDASASCGAQGYVDGVTVTASAIVPGRGSVPLGFGVGADDPDPYDGTDQRDGTITPGPDQSTDPGFVPLGFAPPHDGLEGFPQIFTATSTLTAGEARLGQVGVLSETEELPAFLGFAGGAFEPGATVSITPVEGANLYRARLSDAAGNTWSIWTSVPVGPISLEALRPADLAGRDTEMAIQAVRLRELVAEEDLFSLRGVRLSHLNAVLEAWSSLACVEASAEVAAPHCARE